MNKKIIAITIGNCVRGLVIDMIESADSGHPGMPLGMADVLTGLFLTQLRFNNLDPKWINRDRLIISGGQGGTLLYALLHLCEYDISLDDLKNFRQIGSKTPGFPIFDKTPGVEVTTASLGQGIANGVGFAIAAKHLNAAVGDEENNLINYRTFVVCGDGDLMEGVSYEAISLAGHLGLNNLAILYDDNKITIDGNTSITWTEDIDLRFKSCNWDVIHLKGHNSEDIKTKLECLSSLKKPTLVRIHTIIGKGSPKVQGKKIAHGKPLGISEAAITKKLLHLNPTKSFQVPSYVRNEFKKIIKKNQETYAIWQKRFADSNEEKTLQKVFNPVKLSELFIPTSIFPNTISIRNASGIVLQFLFEKIPSLFGGSADVSSVVRTNVQNQKNIKKDDFNGRLIPFGIREHSMAAILNGISLSGFKAFGGCFTVFSDYYKPSLRLAALMKLPIIYLLTHDSFFIGQDGSTHQPVEQLASFRALPNCNAMRPANAYETHAAWINAILSKETPSIILMSGHEIPSNQGISHESTLVNFNKGAYTIFENNPYQKPDIIIIGTGSEVQLALETLKHLDQKLNVRIISMPSWYLFNKQPLEYQKELLQQDHSCLRVSIEAGSSLGWEKYVGQTGLIISLDDFGESGLSKDLAFKLGFTPKQIATRINASMKTFSGT